MGQRTMPFRREGEADSPPLAMPLSYMIINVQNHFNLDKILYKFLFQEGNTSSLENASRLT